MTMMKTCRNRIATLALPAALLFASGAASGEEAPIVEEEPEEAAPVQVVTGIFDGMVISTADVYGNIEVRAMSYGPGFCTTHITVGDQTVSIAAPPAIYSGWVTATSHSGSIGFAVSKRDICDTGTEVQVRYWK